MNKYITDFTKKTAIALYAMLAVFFTGCNTECKEVDKSFRPHIVTHHYKSKVYYYYHLTPCSKCISVDDDINGEGYSHYEPVDFVTFQDNGEVIYGRRYSH